MREIKFRAWDAKQNNYVGYIQATSAGFKQVHDVRAFFAESPSLIYQQYTGLKDKNGVEIYEGDIVRDAERGQQERWWGVVVWQETLCGFHVTYHKPRNKRWTDLHNFADTNVTNWEVIGNIYENPELLETSA